MKKILAIILALLCLTAFISCGDGEEIPDGMQLVFGGEDVGYYFYAPSEWITSNVGDIKAAYISTLNNTSVSFTEIKLEDTENPEEYFFTEYFGDSMTALDSTKISDFTLKENGKTYTLGAKDYTADRAVQYIYTYKYPTPVYKENTPVDKPEYEYHEFGFMQILAMHGGRFYILTYSAQNEAKEGITPNYDKYLEMFTSVIENFRFVDKNGEGEKKPEYTLDSDGYKLISEHKHAGFDFYVPEDFEPDFSSAAVSASHSDGSNVTITQATSVGVYASDYWTMRKNELSTIVTELEEVTKDGEAQVNIPTRLGNNSSTLYGDWAYSYEYTFKYNGVKYHVYQILAIDGTKGYTFTYTASEENYAEHFESVLKIIEKVRF